MKYIFVQKKKSERQKDDYYNVFIAIIDPNTNTENKICLGIKEHYAWSGPDDHVPKIYRPGGLIIKSNNKTHIIIIIGSFLFVGKFYDH